MATRFVAVGDDLQLPAAMARTRNPPAQGIGALRGDTEILRDATGTRTVDGAGYFTAARVGGALGEWYGYVTGHDSTAMWLVTADAAAGPWTWRQAVFTVPTSHVSSPHLEYVDGTFRLYYHDHESVAQSTRVRTSADGVTFSAPTLMLDAPGNSGNYAEYNSWATTYFRAARAPSGWAGVYQANNLFANAQAGGVTTGIGFATSEDGLVWNMGSRPLVGNRPGERGPFAPCLFRVAGTWLLVARVGTALEFYSSATLEPGTFAFAQSLSVTGVTPGAPSVIWDGETLHLFYGAFYGPSSPATTHVRHAYLDWSA